MDRLRQQTKKANPVKHHDKSKPLLHPTDVKTIKENIKIKEILRTVKINSSMRIKAPRGSKVMSSKDLNDSTDTELSEDVIAMDTNSPDILTSDSETILLMENNTDIILGESNSDSAENVTSGSDKNKSELTDTLSCLPNIVTGEKPIPSRVRKLSLDQTMLSRRPSLSQSEADLCHSLGKSPLERKSSFFRKKMESFFRNTSEVFKRQSISKADGLQRRGSMSYSLQSLNDKHIYSDKYISPAGSQEIPAGSTSSLNSTPTLGASESSLTGSQPDGLAPEQHLEQLSLSGSQPLLSTSQPLDLSESVNSLNEAYIQEQMLNSRAISMSSGLDSAKGSKKRRKSRANRVTWLASEGLTNYLRRVIQDEKSKEIQTHQDSETGPKTDSRGRRLSYQRAVSGEDPVRYSDSMRRRHFIPENFVANYDLTKILDEFTRNGVPALEGFTQYPMPEDAFKFLYWAETATTFDSLFEMCYVPAGEEPRQAVIKELVATEVDYIRHLIAIVEVFIASAHILQDHGMLLDVDTARLFVNIPDVLNASLCFWNTAIYPMVADAIKNKTTFNTVLMHAGFFRFREIMAPYEKYVCEQSKALDYLRSLSTNADFQIYLSWCHAQKSCNRLLLSDILVKPMQRLTKYSLILCRIITYSELEPERTGLIAMETFAKNYVLDLNRTIRQREELDKLDALIEMIDVYDVKWPLPEYKDEEMDKIFRAYTSLNLKAPMVGCVPQHSRSLIYEGDLRFRDHQKEIEVRAFLLTDMLLICKKNSKGSHFPYKLIRPKFMIDKMVYCEHFSKTKKELVALMFIVVDDVGSAYHSFTISDSSKESNSQLIRAWELKIREAKITYNLGVWFARNPSRDPSEGDHDSSSDYASRNKGQSDDNNIEREARERVAAMLHRSMGASTEHDVSQASLYTDSFDGEGSGTSGIRTPAGMASLRHPMHRTSTGGSSRNSRLSSFQQSTSAASHDEPQPGPSRMVYRAGSSVEHIIPPQHPNDDVKSITVNVLSESESETMVPRLQQVRQLSAPQPRPPSRSSSTTNQHTLKVQPTDGIMALVHSLPDLTIDPSPRHSHSSSPQSASEKLYQSHQELLNRNRLSARGHSSHYLSPDHRGISYPPPSPTRGSLTRGMAFSYSLKNPPLAKMGHVNSQSQQPVEALQPGSQDVKPSTSANTKVSASTNQTTKSWLTTQKSSDQTKASTLIQAKSTTGKSSKGKPSKQQAKELQQQQQPQLQQKEEEERGAINTMLVRSTSRDENRYIQTSAEDEAGSSSKHVSNRHKGRASPSPDQKEGD